MPPVPLPTSPADTTPVDSYSALATLMTDLQHSLSVERRRNELLTTTLEEERNKSKRSLAAERASFTARITRLEHQTQSAVSIPSSPPPPVRHTRTPLTPE